MGIDYSKRPQSGQGTPPAPAQSAPPATPAPSAGPVSLTKAAPAVSLSKGQATGGTMRVNLNWNARPQQGGGFLSRLAASRGIDLDLGALYELADGSLGCVQALGNAFRDRTHGPAMIWLDGDDRSGSSQGGENLYVDLSRLGEIKRVLIFAFIYEGVPNWAAADGVVTLMPVGAPPISVRLDEHGSTPMCGIAMLENHGGQLVIHRLVHHFNGHRQMDEHYRFGMQWTPGSK